MILAKLYECSEAILGESLAPPMYEKKPVRWFVEIEGDGRAVIRSNSSDGPKDRGLPHMVPIPGPRSGKVLRPALLADTPEYVFGVGEPGRRAPQKHEAFLHLVERCAMETNDAGVRAVVSFFGGPQFDPARLPDGVAPNDLITFRVNGRWVVDSPSVRSFWARSARPDGDSSAGLECLVTGQVGPVDESLTQMIKGLPNGQTSGVALISANKLAFESYGLKRAQTSPISRDAAERITKALNYLIARRESRVIVGGVVYVFWTRRGADNEIATAMVAPTELVVKNLIESYRTGKPAGEFDDEEFYAFALSANAARVVVRDQLSTTIGVVRRNLAAWFSAQSMVEYDGSPGVPLTVFKIGAAAFRDAAKEADPGVWRSLVRTALQRDPIPSYLLARAVMRCRADRKVTRSRAVLIKMVLFPVTRDMEDSYETMAALDKSNTVPAYLCGRLLAQLASIQRAALGDLNANIVDRFYGAASTAPATVLPLMLNLATKAHLPKIRKSRPGWYNGLEARLMEITDNLAEFPRILTLNEQGLFALGFYHQKAFDRATAKAKNEENLSRQSSTEEPTP